MLGITFGLLITLILLLIIYVKFKKHRLNNNEHNNKDDILLDYLTPLTIKQLPLHFNELKENPVRLKAEYTQLVLEPGTTAHARLPINKRKNRYIDILPCK